VRRGNVDVANDYAGESDFRNDEVIVQRPAEIKGQAIIMLPRVQRLR